MASLEKLGQQHGTDKLRHGYLPHLERLVSAFRHESFDLLEIGVKDGASIRMWLDYFPHARIVGVDIKPSKIAADLPRYVFAQGSQIDPNLLDQLTRQYRLRVIVDDGSHLWPHQILTFKTLFPHLEPGGVYVCEDLHTSFGAIAEKYRAGAHESAATWFLRVAESVVAGTSQTPPNGAEPIPSNIVRKIRHVSFIRGAVMVAT